MVKTVESAEVCGDRMEMLTRKSVLSRAEECVCGQREQDYGTPEDNFKCIAEMWSAYLTKSAAPPNVTIDIGAVDVAMMMGLLKIARVAGGNHTADSFVDLAGYAACGGECANVR